VNTNIHISNGGFDLQLWHERNLWPDFSVHGVHLRWIRTDECERDRVLSRIAVLQVSRPVAWMRWLRVVLMSGKPVLVLRVIVIGVVVDVQQGHRAGRCDQYRNEQQCEGAMHNVSLYETTARRSKRPRMWSANRYIRPPHG
jgi:hypothetical protein